MKKSELRKVMLSLSAMDVSDDKAVDFIRDLVMYQHYKLTRAEQLFATNCAIFYAGSRSKALLMKSHTVDEALEWEQTFIKRVENIYN